MDSAKKELPRVATREEWNQARSILLAKEKELTHHRDEVNAARRQLPMVEVEKEYEFDSERGKVKLIDLFENRTQLVVYHFMFDPAWDAGCPGCSFLMDNMGHLSHLYARDTSFVMVSLAPLRKLLAYRKRMEWNLPWVSSAGSDFNKDFGATTPKGETHALSSFIRNGSRTYHTYSTFNRGPEPLLGTYDLLDFTALGRQEDWEKPAGRSDTGMMGWLRRHDEYEFAKKGSGCCSECR